MARRLAPLPAYDYRRAVSKNPSSLRVLGIETSCDDTAAALVHLRATELPEVVAEHVTRQDAAHAPYGGIVPEIAAREHAALVDQAVEAVMQRRNWAGIDVIAATAGPGLIGGVMVGLNFAKGLSVALSKPFIAVNHLEAHALSVQLSHQLAYPYLLLLVSGGHSQLLRVTDLGEYQRLGSTIDDAAGEAFDKTAKLLGLPHPGGPALEQLAASGDETRFALPRPLSGGDRLDFSFAGLKTATARYIARDIHTDQDRADLAAGFQRAMTDCLVDRAARALAAQPDVTAFVAAGGVAANRTIRTALEAVATAQGIDFIAPPMRWCTDNAAMVALAGGLHFAKGRQSDLDTGARARWPLDAQAASRAPSIGSGRKGPKA